MKSLTKNIGKSHAEGKLNQNFVVKRVLISRPNHRLGNILLLTPLVQEIEKTFPKSFSYTNYINYIFMLSLCL